MSAKKTRSKKISKKPVTKARLRKGVTKALKALATPNRLPLIGEFLASEKGIVGAIVSSLDGKGLDALVVPCGDDKRPTIFDDVEYRVYGTEIKGAGSLVDGQANTEAMAKAGSTLAEKILKLKAFLPAKHDLMAIYASCKSLNLFPDNYFWSSSQLDSYDAWVQDFEYGNVHYWDKGDELKAFPVRRVRIQ